VRVEVAGGQLALVFECETPGLAIQLGTEMLTQIKAGGLLLAFQTKEGRDR
jgi:hypothetical protein